MRWLWAGWKSTACVDRRWRLPLPLLTICGLQSYEWVGGAVEWVGGACAVGGWGLWIGWVGPVEWVGGACGVGR